jgi:hypothetical protein
MLAAQARVNVRIKKVLVEFPRPRANVGFLAYEVCSVATQQDPSDLGIDPLAPKLVCLLYCQEGIGVGH